MEFASRFVLIVITIFLGWVLASVGMLGISDEELASQPLDSWRARIKAAIRYLGRLTLRSETNLKQAIRFFEK